MEVKNLLNGHSLLASLYRHTYLKQVPHGLCDYVWGVLFELLALPFTWTVIVYNIFSKHITLESDNTYDISWSSAKPINGFLNTIWFLFGGILFSCMIDVEFESYGTSGRIILAYLLGLAGTAILIGTLIFIIAIFEWYHDKFPKKKTYAYKPYVPQKPSIFKLIWRGLVAFKEKNCPVITWDYTKKPK